MGRGEHSPFSLLVGVALSEYAIDSIYWTMESGAGAVGGLANATRGLLAEMLSGDDVERALQGVVASASVLNAPNCSAARCATPTATSTSTRRRSSPKKLLTLPLALFNLTLDSEASLTAIS